MVLLILTFADVCSFLKDRLQNEVQLHVRPVLIARFAVCGGEVNEIIGISQYFNK